MAIRKAKVKVAHRATATRGSSLPTDRFADPRLRPGFQPEQWPLCNGGDAPPARTTDLVERRQIEFLAAYYRLNQLYARLQMVRLGAAAEDTQPLLTEIQDALLDRDGLEDRYEPEGFLGEPVMMGVFYKDIEFTHARRHQSHEPASSSNFSLFIPLPPPGADLEEWIQAHLAGTFPELAAAAPARSTPPAPPAKKKPKPKPKLKQPARDKRKQTPAVPRGPGTPKSKRGGR